MVDPTINCAWVESFGFTATNICTLSTIGGSKNINLRVEENIRSAPILCRLDRIEIEKFFFPELQHYEGVQNCWNSNYEHLHNFFIIVATILKLDIRIENVSLSSFYSCNFFQLDA